MGMKVAKFGGSSLADAAQFRKVKEILLMDADRRIVVPSAPGKRSSTDIKVTDLFYECNRLAAGGKEMAECFDTIRARFHSIADELRLSADLDAHLDEIYRNIQLGAGADYTSTAFCWPIIWAGILSTRSRAFSLTRRAALTATGRRPSWGRFCGIIRMRLCRAFTDATRMATSRHSPAAAATSRAPSSRAR